MTDSFTLHAELPVRPSMLEGMKREWDRLANAGTWWSGADRVALAATARAAASATPSPSSHLAPDVAAMARRIMTSAHEIDRASVDALVDQAKARIAGRIRPTPLTHSSSLSEMAGAPVHLKLEHHQITGSFKLRGATNALLWKITS